MAGGKVPRVRAAVARTAARRPEPRSIRVASSMTYGKWLLVLLTKKETELSHPATNPLPERKRQFREGRIAAQADKLIATTSFDMIRLQGRPSGPGQKF